ncbi:MAG: hypothetical protein LBU65_00865, partial [Planctomycetaceae bacterium]|nr:hypothetical protein [Planctomycetaceae bacterium]
SIPRWIESLLLLTPLTTIFTAGLIELDKRQLSDKIFNKRVYISGVVVGLIMLMIGEVDIDARVAFDYTNATFGIGAGIIAGMLTMNFLPHGHRRGWLVSLVVLGTFCGWLDVCIAVPVSLLITAWANIVLRQTVPQLSLALVAFVVVCVKIFVGSH